VSGTTRPVGAVTLALESVKLSASLPESGRGCAARYETLRAEGVQLQCLINTILFPRLALCAGPVDSRVFSQVWSWARAAEDEHRAGSLVLAMPESSCGWVRASLPSRHLPRVVSIGCGMVGVEY